MNTGAYFFKLKPINTWIDPCQSCSIVWETTVEKQPKNTDIAWRGGWATTSSFLKASERTVITLFPRCATLNWKSPIESLSPETQRKQSRAADSWGAPECCVHGWEECAGIKSSVWCLRADFLSWLIKTWWSRTLPLKAAAALWQNGPWLCLLA